MKQVAVIGSGISGLATAYLLSRKHVVTLFEKDGRLGGHTHTVVVDRPSGPVALDTGFLVHNDRTYPRLVRLFAELGVDTAPSDMSFSVSCERTGLEYSSRGANGFFAQRRNLWNLEHLRLLREILRFNGNAGRLLQLRGADATVGDLLDEGRFSEAFAARYLLPMASAIWSAPMAAIRAFPALTMVRFLENHGLLAVNGQPIWKVVRGGSHSYIPRMAAPFKERVHTHAAIERVSRGDRGVTLVFFDRPEMQFDEVVFACHGNQVLPLLQNPSDTEREVFSAFRTTTNCATLHTDSRLLPRRAAARASWNYRLSATEEAAPTVTYDLNRLQTLPTDETFCVTLNDRGEVDPATVIRRIPYAHPEYTSDTVRAQARWREVSGANRTHYAGAYWFYGFHEDGVRSAERVAVDFGVTW